jgi:predicted transcriptional regulator
MVRSDETEWKFSQMSKKGWGSDPLAVDAVNAFASMEASCTIRLIGTFEPNLIFCHEDDVVHEICELERYRPFDYLPVKRDAHIVGLLSLVTVRNIQASSGDIVSHHMTQIDDNTLIASDSGILSFIGQADEHPCRLILSNMKIDGIVVLADLQKLPVRSSIFFLITHLELLMATTLRSKFNDDNEWLSLLSPNRQGKIEEKWNTLRTENMEIDRVLATEFCDKRDSILKSGLLRTGLTQKQATKELKDIEELRNHIAHAGDIASTHRKALQTVTSVKSARQWISYFNDLLTAWDDLPPKA